MELPNIDRLAGPNCVREPSSSSSSPSSSSSSSKRNISEKDFRGIFLNRHAHARHQQQKQQGKDAAQQHGKVQQQESAGGNKLSDLVFYDHVRPFPLNAVNWEEWCGTKRNIRCFQCAQWVRDVYPLCVPIDFECGLNHDETNVWKMRPHFAHWKCVYTYVNTRYNTFACRSVGLITLMGIRLYELNPLTLSEYARAVDLVPNPHPPRLDHVTRRNHTIVMEQANIVIQHVYRSVPQTTNGVQTNGPHSHDDDDDEC